MLRTSELYPRSRSGLMQDRVQASNELTCVYFFDKLAMCEDLGLSFAEAKELILIGLYSREMCAA